MKNCCRSSKGQFIVMVALLLIVLLALVGLALDVGRAYGVRAKLNAAVDAAGIAGGRGLKQGATDSVRIQNAIDAATNAFSANFGGGYLGSTPATGSVQTVCPPPATVPPGILNVCAQHLNQNGIYDGSWTVNVDAARSVPTYLAKLVGWTTFNVHTHAQTIVRTLDMMLVLDCSSSLGSNFVPLKTAAINFVNKFQEGAGGDRVGLVAFSDGAAVIVPIDKTTQRGFGKTAPYNNGTVTLPAMDSSINGLGMGSYTASAEGMRRALYELDLIPHDIRSTLRAIVFFSDGAPNTLSGNFSGTFPSYDVVGTGSGSTLGMYSQTDVSSSPKNTLPTYLIPTVLTTGMTHAIDYLYIQSAIGYPSVTSYSPSGVPLVPLPPLPADILTQRVDMQSYYNNPRRSLPSGNIPRDGCNVNKAARNMVENIANTARSGTGTDAVTIYTIGLGAHLKEDITGCYGGSSSEYGQNIMQRLANVKGVDTYNGNQPAGLYAYAADSSQLNNAFTTIANQILRLSQ